MISKKYKILKDNNLDLEVNSIHSIEEIARMCPRTIYDEPCFILSSETTCIQCLMNEGFIEPVQSSCSDTKTLADYLIDGNIVYTSANNFGVIAGDYIYYVDGFDKLASFYPAGVSSFNTKIEAVYRNEYNWSFKVVSSNLSPTIGLELVWQSVSFTEQENNILNALSSKYDIISRDANGKLSIESSIDHTFCSFHMYDHLFLSLLNSISHKFR